MKKAQGLSLNIMVIAAIVLVVIIVSLAVFTNFINGRAVPFLSEQNECATQVNSGECTVRTDCSDGTAVFGLGCPDDKPYCCIPSN